jgi:hypothetical protein
MTPTLITAAIIIGATFLFIMFFSLLHKRDRKQKLAKQKIAFSELVARNQLEISEKEELNNYIIAIDKNKFQLVYLDFSGTDAEKIVIDLRKVKSVKVDTEENSIYEERKGKSILIEKQVIKLQLAISLNDPHLSPNFLPFYQMYKDGIQDFTTVKNRAEYWQNIIMSCHKQITDRSKQTA